jgi:two-component system response regulator PilR (NtrC family)
MEDIQIISDTFLSSSAKHNETTTKKSQVVFASRPTIVYFDDDQSFSQKICDFLANQLNADVKRIHSFHALQEILPAIINSGPFAFVFHATSANYDESVLFMEQLKQRKVSHFVLALSGHGMMSQMIRLAENELFHYLMTPFSLPVLGDVLVKCFAKKVKLLIAQHSSDDLWPEKKVPAPYVDQFFANQITEGNLSHQIGQEEALGSLVGKSSIMRLLFDRVARAATQDVPVYLCGEEGTGKKTIAKMIHQLSAHHLKSMNEVSCRTLPTSILDQELFGKALASQKDNQVTEASLIEQSNASSFLIEDIDFLSKQLQDKLLKFVQTKQLPTSMGAKSSLINVRLILTGEKNLEKLVLEGKFKEEFLFSLGHTLIKVPALRERKEDLPLLISYFIKKYASSDKSNAIIFSSTAMEVLVKYDWPGNVKELEDLVKHLLLFKSASTINPEDLPVSIHSPKVIQVSNLKDQIYLPETGINLKKLISDIEDTLIMQATHRTNGNKHKAAQLLGLNRTTLIEKMKKKKLT